LTIEGYESTIWSLCKEQFPTVTSFGSKPTRTNRVLRLFEPRPNESSGKESRRYQQKIAPRLFIGRIHYNRLPKGGHFAAWEQPQFLSQEIRTGLRSLRSAVAKSDANLAIAS